MPAADIGTFRIVDENDLTSVLEDLDDNVRTAVRELELRVPQRETSFFEPANAPGGSATRSRDPLVITGWKQSLFYADQTYDQLTVRARNIVMLLRRGGTIEFTPRDSVTPLYIDYEKGSGFALFGESPEDTFRALTGRAYPAGVPIQIVRQPHVREIERNPAVNLWTNATMLADSDRNGTPDGWTSDAGTHTIQSLVEAFQISHSGAVDLAHRDYTAAAGTQVAVGIEARKVSGDRTVEIRLLSMPSATVLATATVTASAWGTRYSVTGTVAGGDTGVRVSIRYQSGSNATVSQFRDSQLQTGTLVASSFRVGAEPVSNDPAAAAGGRSLVLVDAGSAPAPFKLNIQAEAGDTPRIEEFYVALRAADGIVGHRRLSDYLNETRFSQLDASANGWTRTLGTDTASAADTDASGGNAAECTYATNALMARRVHITRVTLLDSLRGFCDVIARCKPSAASEHLVQARWAPSLADPAPYVGQGVPEDGVSLDWSDATSFSYVDVNLGTIYLSEDPAHALAGLALEIWSQRISGSGNMRFDEVSLVATDPFMGDTVSVLSVPGSSREHWLGKALVTPTNPSGLTAGAVKNNRLRLNAANEAGGTPPVGGIGWPAGRHKVTFRIDGNGRMDWTGRVRNITDSNDAVSRAFAANRKPAAVGEFILRFDSVAGKSYQPQLYITGGIDAGDYLDIKRIVHEFTPYVGASEQMRADPEKGLVEKLDSTGSVLSYMTLAGPMPLWAPPGRSVLVVIPADIRIHSGATHPESKLVRDLTVMATHAPRHPL
jgi:hypothetical protein